MAFRGQILFDILSNILKMKSMSLYNTHIGSECISEASTFIILKYLSMCENCAVRDVVLKDYLILEKMNVPMLYKTLIRSIPKQQKTFIKFIK